MDAAILMNPETWVASGHVGGFSDPLMDCKTCKTRHRADKLIEDFARVNNLDVNPAGWTNAQLAAYIREKGIDCPDCGGTDFTDVRQFNLMFKTYQGVTEESGSELYLRPETAQEFYQFQEYSKNHPQEAALRCLSDRKGLPQRDHARQLHLPHP